MTFAALLPVGVGIVFRASELYHLFDDTVIVLLCGVDQSNGGLSDFWDGLIGLGFPPRYRAAVDADGSCK